VQMEKRGEFNNGSRLHDDEGVCPARPDAPKGDPEGTIAGPDAWPATLDHRGELLPEGDVLEKKLAARTEGGAERRGQRRGVEAWRAKIMAKGEIVEDSKPNGILARNRRESP